MESSKKQPGINAVIKHLDGAGLFSSHNEDLLGPDILVFSGFKKAYYIEVEVEGLWRAKSAEFPFQLVYVPEYKGKFLRKGLPTEFWFLRWDLKKAIIIPDYTLNSSLLREMPKELDVSNEGKKFYYVPITDCIAKDLK